MNTFGSLTELFEKIEAYGKTTYELSKLRLLNATTNVVTSLITSLIVFVVAFLFVVLLSIAAALFLGELLGKLYYGFIIVAAFYFVVGIISHFFLYKLIKKPIGNSIIKQALKQ